MWQSKHLYFILYVFQVLELVGNELFGQGDDILLDLDRVQVELNCLRTECVDLMFEEV